MAKINLKKAIEQGNKLMDVSYSMPASVMLEIATKGGCDAVHDAFVFGYYQGTKATKVKIKKKNTL